jgi:hypothetical protein
MMFLTDEVKAVLRKVLAAPSLIQLDWADYTVYDQIWKEVQVRMTSRTGALVTDEMITEEVRELATHRPSRFKRDPVI